ncbi:hypothetical protein SLEP1_g30256 [Rubroshorea leprosula]|uniref:Uncharacterized protein n=1 Tax=Rubroshorea leprosula TaxID=152421 RepID=A0AAV5K7B6_9ROSI|nr:hypothetical protein SLEP1_g30256 [Rubroshorea leprosula]
MCMCCGKCCRKVNQSDPLERAKRDNNTATASSGLSMHLFFPGASYPVMFHPQSQLASSLQ